MDQWGFKCFKFQTLAFLDEKKRKEEPTDTKLFSSF